MQLYSVRQIIQINAIKLCVILHIRFSCFLRLTADACFNQVQKRMPSHLRLGNKRLRYWQMKQSQANFFSFLFQSQIKIGFRVIGFAVTRGEDIPRIRKLFLWFPLRGPRDFASKYCKNLRSPRVC